MEKRNMPSSLIVKFSQVSQILKKRIFISDHEVVAIIRSNIFFKKKDIFA